jgi:hypothetical protein
MADYSFSQLSSATSGFSTTSFQAQSISSYTIESSNGTISVGNLNISFNETIPGWLSGRRPVNGQVFPRGVYNR